MESLPAKIGRYEILSTIGRGAMGVVYRALDPLIGREVALKTVTLSGLLPPEQLAEFKARFFREAKAAGVLHHPHIVTIHDVGEQEGVPFMAMELVEGVSLSALLKERGKLPAPEAVALIRQVAQGLAFAHGKGVVHRDIKPDNILVEGATGRAVIADFGIAHMEASELTRTGEVLGTPYYMSPEQILGTPLDGRADLFSLGVVLYLALTGQRPFRGETISSVCYHIVHEEPEPLPPDAAIPENLAPILLRLLAKDPQARYPDGRALSLDLDRVMGNATVSGPVPSPDCTLDLGASPAPLGKGSGSRATVGVPEQGLGGEEKRKRYRVLWIALGLAALLLSCLFGARIAQRVAARKALEQPPSAQESPGKVDPSPRKRKGPPGKSKKTRIESGSPPSMWGV